MLKNFVFLISVVIGYRRKFINGENFLIYGIVLLMATCKALQKVSDNSCTCLNELVTTVQ